MTSNSGAFYVQTCSLVIFQRLSKYKKVQALHILGIFGYLLFQI